MLIDYILATCYVVTAAWVGVRQVMAENLDHAPQQSFQLPILVDESKPDKSSRMNIKDIILESAKHLKYQHILELYFGFVHLWNWILLISSCESSLLNLMNTNNIPFIPHADAVALPSRYP